MNVYSVNNDPEVFPQPRTFKPERFYKDGAYQTNENLILFGKGKNAISQLCCGSPGQFLDCIAFEPN